MISRYKWFSLMILFSVIPMGLLFTFRSTGVLSNPSVVAETNVLQNAELDLERPDTSIHILRAISNEYGDELLFLNTSCLVDLYVAGDIFGSDAVALGVHVFASLQKGYAVSVNISYYEHYQSSWIRIDRPGNISGNNFGNLELSNYAEDLSVNDLKANVQFAGVKEPDIINLTLWGVNWELESSYDHSHLLETRIELIYFNGTTFRRIAQPFTIRIGPDDNNSIDTAAELHGGTYEVFFLDSVDYYRIFTAVGQRVSVSVKPYLPHPSDIGPTFNATLFDSTMKVIDAVKRKKEFTLEIGGESTGYHYIELLAASEYTGGYYSVEVTG